MVRGEDILESVVVSTKGDVGGSVLERVKPSETDAGVVGVVRCWDLGNTTQRDRH